MVHSISAREVIVCSSRRLKEPGTLFKNLMAILRDVVICYDSTVRNVTIKAVMIIFLRSNQALRSDLFRGGATWRSTETFSLSSQVLGSGPPCAINSHRVSSYSFDQSPLLVDGGIDSRNSLRNECLLPNSVWRHLFILVMTTINILPQQGGLVMEPMMPLEVLRSKLKDERGSL
ncbi:hypothetical protein RHMOL_Rhmol01G0031600 [Rhododendron molle]|uniref:Uncharacterized protein n=1 Tax=Rhododendron molle TaxID=49168 RepID=A0ACC0PZ47_RHOML|nr:hypothetical protein RHMOL_Rhmol01G0031600 [Rhododendron molle]